MPTGIIRLFETGVNIVSIAKNSGLILSDAYSRADASIKVSKISDESRSTAFRARSTTCPDILLSSLESKCVYERLTGDSRSVDRPLSSLMYDK